MMEQRNEAPPTTMKQVKRMLVAVAGGTVFAAGIAMILLPGPAIVVIPAGLTILAIEFAWARRWLRSVRAVLPHRTSRKAVQRTINYQSIRRSVDFLFRQVRHTFARKKGTQGYLITKA